MTRTGILCLMAAAAFGQTFEVASVKPHEGPMRRLGVTTAGQRLTCDSCNLLMMVMFAYDVKNFQMTGTAPLAKEDNTRWDVVAKSGGDQVPTRADFRRMMKALLADRFQLKLHEETREIPVYALVAAKSGPKFKPSDPDADSTFHYSSDKAGNTVITLPTGTMSDVVDAVSNGGLDRPVVDQTGLTGIYDIKLTYTPRRTDEPELYISVFHAVEEQLGLKLEPRNAPVRMLIVDQAVKPSEN